MICTMQRAHTWFVITNGVLCLYLGPCIFQEELYDLILETNRECVKLCKPGVSIQEIHNYSV